MNPKAYFTDLSSELRAVQNRIRQLIGDRHWPSDGGWKESVLRSILRGYLPPSVSVGSGFVVTPAGPSPQIDILIFDDSAPVLFRDGDFVVATADAVRAAIEVKTMVTRDELVPALRKLSLISHQLRSRCLHNRPFIGLFSYEPTKCPPRRILETLKAENGRIGDYEITALSFGDSQFYRYWQFEPGHRSGQLHDSWHAYVLAGLAPGYFIHNVIEHLYPHVVERAEDIWYPVDGKESRRVGQIKRRALEAIS
jgi:hypothetical protein